MAEKSGISELIRDARREQDQHDLDSPEGAGDADKRRAMENELEKAVREAFVFYEEKFTTLPSVQRLRELWAERDVSASDPIWLMVDVLALYDARGQIALQQIVRILRACQELNQHTIKEMRGALETATTLQLTSAEAGLKADALLERMGSFAKLMERAEKQTPVLLNTMYRATAALDNRSKRAVWELAGVVVGALVVGMVITEIIHKFM